MEALNRKQLQPIEHPGLIRLGFQRDGGYIVPEAQVRSSTVLLSLGMNDDWSFDRDFMGINAGVRVIGVDYSVGSLFFARRVVMSLLKLLGYALLLNRRKFDKYRTVLRDSLDYFSFFAPPHQHIRKRVSGADTESEISVARLLEAAGAEDDHGVFLKMDVEGSEYELIPDIVSGEGRINCIAAEFHYLHTKTATFNRAMTQLLEHFRIVHIHGNNYGIYDPRNDFPESVEITFVNKALIEGTPALSQREYPRADLDFPNWPERPDHPLRFE